MIISYPASPSRIIVLLKTLRHIIENLKKKSERKERSFRENREKEIIFRSNAIKTSRGCTRRRKRVSSIRAMGEFDQNEVCIDELEHYFTESCQKQHT